MHKVFAASLLLFLAVSIMGCTQETTLPPHLEQKARFEPPAGTILVFVGQDNASVGGNAHFRDGYVDHIGVPGGITHYVGMGADASNKFMTSPDSTHINGLSTETQWGAGPMCMKYYVDSPILDRCVIHLSLSMTGNNEDKLAEGTLDHLIDELAAFLSQYGDTPFLLRIGYEFDGPWNNYDPENFIKAFRRIVDQLRAAPVSNFATVMASSACSTSYEDWQRYYPGDQYVDWFGYSYWDQVPAESECGSLRFAREKHKPVFIAESTPRGHFLDKEGGEQLWKEWYEPFFCHMEQNSDVIRAFSYINCDWDAQPMWKGQNWGNSRIETNAYIKKKWQKQMRKPQFINAKNRPFKQIRFTPSKTN